MLADSSISSAQVVGAGPNGLAAAIVLAQHKMPVEVFEAEPEAGGAARTLELTLPGFLHDFGSAVHPLAAASPFFNSLPLAKHGLDWIHSPAALAHPFDDGSAICLENKLPEATRSMGRDGPTWRRIVEPFVESWPALSSTILGPISLRTRHPILLARFGLAALPPARFFARGVFRTPAMQALFAGMAAHSGLSLTAPFSAAFGVLLGLLAHVAGWPIPRGGSRSISDALVQHLLSLGAVIHTSHQIESISGFSPSTLTMCDVSPRQFVQLASKTVSANYSKRLLRFRYGPGAFKVDYALNGPIPWRALECSRAATVHLGGSLDEICISESQINLGQHADRPFVILAQPSLFDATRAPAGQHTAWAYCHVPNGSPENMLVRIENQIERFAPGFRDTVIARRIFSPQDLELMDANLAGGDITGGAANLRQILFRPTRSHYRTSARNVYLCSASTPPGGGVHGMCGYHAAQTALSRLKS